MTKVDDTSKTESPKSKLERQRAVDRNIQRVRKIEALAKACGDESAEAFVSFGLMGVSYVLAPDEARPLAAAMLEQALNEHDADPDAGDLPKDLQWVHEAVSAAKVKSPSMKPGTEPKKKETVTRSPPPPQAVGR